MERADGDEIAHLRAERSFPLKLDQATIRTTLEPWGIRFWAFEPI